MPDENIEHLLRSLPVRTLAPEAEREIVGAIRATEHGPRSRWWHRSIPLWQAAAACVLAGVVAWWLGASQEPDGSPAPPPKTLFVSLDEPLFTSERSSPDRLDISRWQTPN